MISQQFVDFIKNQLAAGIPAEDVKNALRIHRLSEQDIADGFAIANATPLPKMALVQPSVARATVAPVVSMWGKGIPRTNWVFMGTSLLLVFGLDLFVLMQSNFSLMPFWIEMLIVFGVFTVFFSFENYVFSKKFSSTRSALDPWISLVIVLRNLVFVLNFVPVIQVLGMLLLGGFLAIIPAYSLGGGLGGDLGPVGLVGPGLFVIYGILITCRFSVSKND